MTDFQLVTGPEPRTIYPPYFLDDDGNIYDAIETGGTHFLPGRRLGTAHAGTADAIAFVRELAARNSWPAPVAPLVLHAKRIVKALDRDTGRRGGPATPSPPLVDR